jgi:uracil-DNA glycosylase family 4
MDKKRKLEELKSRMAKDKTLPLQKGATNLVFGDGDPESKILFIGEGPGYWEDVRGIPFVGNAGALLNQMLTQIGIPREEVYITNIIHFRPPENRDPQPTEIAAFKPYLDEIIKIIDPKVIVTLGRFSMAKFLPGTFISNIHGKPKVVEWGGRVITVVPMYHPAAALRSTEVKEKFKNDFAKLPDILKEPVVKERQVSNNKGEQMNLI